MSSRILASLGVLVCTAELAVATPITVPNGSFEDPVVGNNSVTTTLPTGWGGSSFIGVADPDGNGQGVSGLSWSTPVPDGNQVLHATASTTIGVQAYNSADISVTFAAGQTYTFSVAVGNSYDTDGSMAYHARLLWFNSDFSNYDTMVLFTSATNPVSNGEWADLSGTFTIQPNFPALGPGHMQVILGNGVGYVPGGDDDAYFDNVRIDVSVPEPASLSFAGLGMVALMRRCKR